MRVTGCDAYNVLQNNGTAAHQAVHHVHFHIIPKPSPGQGLGVGWPASSIDHGAAAALAAEIAAAVEQ
jgi:diadenosine tetraphosphate (Ap4A) HIT family hydrolase